MKSFLRNNSLSLVLFFGFFLTSMAGMSFSGLLKYNSDRNEHGKFSVTFSEYVTSTEFLEATAENWESEFFQLFIYVLLTGFLYQKGSAESKDPDNPEEEESPAPPGPDAPWPVRRGGVIAKIYGHSLSLSFLVLFFVSILLHAYGGAGVYNEEQLDHGRTEQVSLLQYMTTSTFWFESLQNWQSEFLAIWAVVIFSIFLREKGSPESKKVEAPHRQTGK